MIKTLLFVAMLMISTPAFAQRYSAIVMDARTNEILHDDGMHDERQPASLTKMMTLYLLFEALESEEITLNTRWTASRNATRQPPTRLGLRCTRRGVCDTLTVEQSIRALVVQSANDVATMVAERLGGSEARFAALMTQQARDLGMVDTTFGNASGLPSTGNRTSAYDMALLSIALWRDFPDQYHFFSIESNRGTRNHNRLLTQVEGMDGLKTGYIRASGFNLATMTERDGVRYVVVVLGGESAASRDAQVVYLTEAAFAQFNEASLLRTSQSDALSN